MQVILVKLSKSKFPTVYVDKDLEEVAASTRMFMEWADESFQWLGFATLVGSNCDHPRYKNFRYATGEETKNFKHLLTTVEAEPRPGT